MNPQTRTNLLLATIVAKIVGERLVKYGVTITAADVLDLFAGAAVAWHLAAPILARYFPPPSGPSAPKA